MVTPNTTSLTTPSQIHAEKKKHPVWDVYDDYRTAVMNVRIQKAHMRRLTRLNYWIEIPLAIAASSTVAGLWFWESTLGGHVWKWLGVVTALLAILKPILKIPDKIQQRGEMLSELSAIENELEKVVKQITQRRKFDKPLCQRYNKILNMKGDLKKKYQNAKYIHVSRRIKLRCAEEVERLYPGNSFFIPED
jgi:hypothetical protein